MQIVRTSYLHDIYSYALCRYPFHVVNQPVNNLCTKKAIERQAFLFWKQLYTCPIKE